MMPLRNLGKQRNIAGRDDASCDQNFNQCRKHFEDGSGGSVGQFSSSSLGLACAGLSTLAASSGAAFSLCRRGYGDDLRSLPRLLVGRNSPSQ